MSGRYRTEVAATLKGVVFPGGTVTAGNASLMSDGASALPLVSEQASDRTGLTPMARQLGTAIAGRSPRSWA